MNARPIMGCVTCLYLVGFGYDRISKRVGLRKSHISRYIKLRSNKIKPERLILWTRPPKMVAVSKPPKPRKLKRYDSSTKRLKVYLRRKLWAWFKHGLYPKSVPLMVGCNRSHFIFHIKSQFTKGMSLRNYAKVWELDHIVPCNQYDLSIPEQRQKAFHFSNIRPLRISENRTKSASVITSQPELLLSHIQPQVGVKSPGPVRSLSSLQQAPRNLSNQQTNDGAESCTPQTALYSSLNN